MVGLKIKPVGAGAGAAENDEELSADVVAVWAKVLLHKRQKKTNALKLLVIETNITKNSI
jgi:hypothetical protein